jgi:hypothetical protein
MARVELKALAMDSTTLVLVIVPLLLGCVFSAAKFMRFIGLLAGGGKRQAARGRSFDDQLSFDERVAERLREMERERR